MKDLLKWRERNDRKPLPYRHISKTAHVAYTRTLVKVYVEGELVATHARNYSKGRYTIVEEHLASKSSEYRGLSAAMTMCARECPCSSPVPQVRTRAGWAQLSGIRPV